MPEFSQTDRPLSVETKLGKDVLVLTAMEGRESVSGLFEFRLSLLSTETSIKAQDLLGTPMIVTVKLADGGERKIHGLVRRFTQLGLDDVYAVYEAELVPWLWLLSLNRDSRVFQQMTAVEIIEKVFKDRNQSDYQVKCTGSFPKREYCVQYRESDLDFVSRLMEEEGIFYFFEHTGSKHTLVLGDAPSAMPVCPGPTTVRFVAQHTPEEEAIMAVRRESAVGLGKVALRAYDYNQPAMKLESSLAGTAGGKQAQGEMYDYPGRFTTVDAGERDARLILESHEAVLNLLRGDGSCSNFVSGHRFTLSNHFAADANTEYVLLEVTHSAGNTGYFAGAEHGYHYQSSFSAIPSSVKYRPPRRTPRPVVHGSQTAVVVGRSGEEIFVDKLGRVKVQFFWDREGKKDDKSSCWVRVSSSWAGKGWGTIQIPRIGQEVIVDFLEGDPDRPIITGRVYNAEQTPPWDLPAQQTVSGLKSRSSKGGSTSTYNEIRLDDKKGSELLLIHAEKDKQVEVENDRTESVGNNETITIKGNRTETVEKDEKITIKGKRTETVEKDETIMVEGKRSAKITGNDEMSTDGKLSAEAATDVIVKAKGGKVQVQGAIEIELKVGGNSIVIGPAGIKIKGVQVQIQGTAQAELKAPMTTVEASGILQVSGTGMANVKSSGILAVRGSLVTIN